MNKVFYVFLMMLTSILWGVNVEEQLYIQTADSIYTSLAAKIPAGQVLLLKSENSDNYLLFKVAERIMSEDKYKLSDQENLKKIFEMNLKQKDIAFSSKNQPKMGSFKPAQWLVLIEENFISHSYPFKQSYKLHANITVDNVESGLSILKRSFRTEKQNRMSFSWLFLSLIAILFSGYFLNYLTKGYYLNWIKFTLVLLIVVVLLLYVF